MAEPAALPVGLDEAEAADRARRGLVNRAPARTSRSLLAIVRANVFTRFNAILATLLVFILTVGPIQDAFFGIVLVVNTGIGIAQEWRAKRTLDRLSLLSAPAATVVRGGQRREIPLADVVEGDVVELRPGSQVVADGEVMASDGLEVDESLLTGEAVPEAKAPGDDVLSGSFVSAGRGWYRADRVGAAAYANALAREARQFALVGSELRDGTNRILRWITWLIVPTGALLVTSQLIANRSTAGAIRASVAGIGATIPEGLVLLTSIAFAVGIVRLGQRKVLVQDLAAIEVLARVDVVCIDKTGTITEPALDVVGLDTLGPAPGSDGGVSVDAVIGAVAGADPEPNATLAALADRYPPPGWTPAWRVAFSSARRFSAAGFGEHGDWVLGAPDMLLRRAEDRTVADRATDLVDQNVREGKRVLLLAAIEGRPGDEAPSNRPAAIVALQERLRPDARETLRFFRHQGVAVKVISGDDPRTVAAVAARVGITDANGPVDARELTAGTDGDGEAGDRHRIDAIMDATSVFGRVGPRQKQAMVKSLRARGHVVAMTGDGVNDVLALKEADLGVAMGSGSAASRAVAPVVLLDSAFASLPPVLAEGRRVIANVERVANLFLTKTAYATLLALAVGVARLPFPFLPRHLTIISSLTIGIPAFFVALAPNRRLYRPGFVERVLRFAVPAGFVAATTTMAAYAYYRITTADESEARTVATITLFLVAMWILGMLVRPTSPWRAGLVLAMVASFVVILAIPWLRGYFALDLPPPLALIPVVAMVAGACAVLTIGWRLSGWGHAGDDA